MQEDQTTYRESALSRLNDYIGPKRAALIIIGLAVLFLFGISFFHTPRYEIIYGTRIIPFTVSDGTQITTYILDMGNTGRDAQSIEFHLRDAPLKQVMLEPSLRNYGITEQPLAVRKEEETVVFRSNPVPADMVVEFRFVLAVPAGRTIPEWDDLMVEIRPEHGRCIRGSPGATKLMRLIYSFL